MSGVSVVPGRSRHNPPARSPSAIPYHRTAERGQGPSFRIVKIQSSFTTEPFFIVWSSCPPCELLPIQYPQRVDKRCLPLCRHGFSGGISRWRFFRFVDQQSFFQGKMIVNGNLPNILRGSGENKYFSAVSIKARG